jgi:hypothetical protein
MSAVLPSNLPMKHLLVACCRNISDHGTRTTGGRPLARSLRQIYAESGRI